MSSTQNPTILESKLEVLPCHFTWDLVPSRSKLLRLRDKLEDIGTEEGNSWLAHIYNLQGYIHYKLGSTEEAQRFFNKAAETFKKTRPDKTEDGPWLVVNYGNQAWLHHHLGNQAESQKYLSKVQDLMEKYPPPPQEELHPEVCTEKAWTLMKFSRDKKLLAIDHFERAVRMQPDRVEWNTSHFVALVSVFIDGKTAMTADILEKMRTAIEKDPENLYLAVLCLEQRGMRGERIEIEACELAEKVLGNPVSSYSGLKVLLWVFINYVSADEAINLAEDALKSHPDACYVRRCVALCYKWIIFSKGCHPKQSTINRAISLHEELISLYPDSSLVKKIDLARIYAKSNHSQDKAEQIYQELLQSDLEAEDKQMLYHKYSGHVYYYQQDPQMSTEYLMKAAEIPHQSFYREYSIKLLEKIRDKNRNLMCEEIKEFLENLQQPQ
ncbi:uncharacterized protein V6R79_003780 [Siganus canaliculatus]